MRILAPEGRGAEQHKELDADRQCLLGLVDMEKETM